MDNDRKYNHALTAAVTIMEELDRKPCLHKFELLALLAYAIVGAMETWEEEVTRLRAEFSAN